MMDLGGCADLNRDDLVEGEAILDPTYGGPEHFTVKSGYAHFPN